MTSPLHRAEQVLTHDIYDPASIAHAIEDYRPHLSVGVLKEDATDTVISFTAPNGEEAPAQVIREFLNYALDLSVRAILGVA